MFISEDGSGERWSAMGHGLPNVPVTMARLQPGNPNRLFISTFGRGIWTYDFPADAQVAVARAAVGVQHQHHVLGSERLRGLERAQDVLRHVRARVADHVRVALLEPEDPLDVQARVHAGHDGEPLCRDRRQAL